MIQVIIYCGKKKNLFFFVLVQFLCSFLGHSFSLSLRFCFCFAVKGRRLISSFFWYHSVNLIDFLTVVKFLHNIMFYINVIDMQIS